MEMTAIEKKKTFSDFHLLSTTLSAFYTVEIRGKNRFTDSIQSKTNEKRDNKNQKENEND